jgi:small subunit ribosomal protein S16
VAVTLRLARFGVKKRPFYRIVAAEKTSRRDGKFLDVVGNYNPMRSPALVNLNEEKVKRWISVGAQTSAQVLALIKVHIPGFIEAKEEAKRNKIREARKNRKARANK